jgi:hypothetical protein
MAKIDAIFKQQELGFLKNFKLEPKQNEIFRFRRPGDRIFARFIALRTSKTRISEAAARVLDCEILESIVVDEAGVGGAGPIGKHSIFGSKGMFEAVDAVQLVPSDCFVLQFLWVGEKSKFKKYEAIKVPPDFRGEIP